MSPRPSTDVTRWWEQAQGHSDLETHSFNCMTVFIYLFTAIYIAHFP